jgi:hypothetical protein
MLHGEPGFARLAAVALVGVSCLAVGACGATSASNPSTVPSDSSRSSVPSASTAPDASSTPDPLASLTARKVATEAIANFKAASTMTLAANLNESGKNIVFNLGLKPGHGCTGTFRESGVGGAKFVIIGETFYLDLDDQFWKSESGSHASAVIAFVDGRYIKTSVNVPGLSLVAKACDLSERMVSRLATGTFTKGKLTTLAGARVLPIEAPNGEMLYVTDTSKPEIAEIVTAKNSGDQVTGKVAFSVGAPVTLTAPPASQVLNGSAIGL